MPLDIFKLQGTVVIETDRAERDLKNLDATAKQTGKALDQIGGGQVAARFATAGQGANKLQGALSGVMSGAAQLKGQAAGLASQLGATSGAFESVALAAGAAGAAVGGFVTVTGLAAAGLVSAANRAAELGEKIGDLKQVTGLSAESLSGLNASAQLSGKSFNVVSGALTEFSKNVVEAQRGNKELQAIFQGLGADIKGGTEPALRQVIARLREASDGANKAAVAGKLFGSAGEDLIPVLNRMEGGLDGATKKAKEMGLYFDSAGVAAAARYTEQTRLLNAQFDGLGVRLGNIVIPSLTSMTSVFNEATGALGRFIDRQTSFGDFAKSMAAFAVIGGNVSLFGSVGGRASGLQPKRSARADELANKGVALPSAPPSAPRLPGGGGRGAATALTEFQQLQKQFAETSKALAGFQSLGSKEFRLRVRVEEAKLFKSELEDIFQLRLQLGEAITVPFPKTSAGAKAEIDKLMAFKAAREGLAKLDVMGPVAEFARGSAAATGELITGLDKLIGDALPKAADLTVSAALAQDKLFQSLSATNPVLAQYYEQQAKAADATISATRATEAFNAMQSQLNDQLQSLSVFSNEQATAVKLQGDAYKGLTEAQRGQLLATARQVDTQTAYRDQLEQSKRALDDFANTMAGTFDTLFERGPKAFFDQMASTLKRTLAQMASDFVTSKILDLLGFKGAGFSRGGGVLGALSMASAGGGGYGAGGFLTGGFAGGNPAAAAIGGSGNAGGGLLGNVLGGSKVGGLLGKLPGLSGLFGRGAASIGGPLTVDFGGALGAGASSTVAVGSGAAKAGLLGGLFSNPVSAVIGGALIAAPFIAKLFGGLFGDKTLKSLRGLVRGEYGIEVKSKQVLENLKALGESKFGKDFKRKQIETVRLPEARDLLADYAERTGQKGNSKLFSAGRLQDPYAPENSFARRAMGGPLAAFQAAIVGERGPEVFLPFTAGRVIPNNNVRIGGQSDQPYLVAVLLELLNTMDRLRAVPPGHVIQQGLASNPEAAMRAVEVSFQRRSPASIGARNLINSR